MAKRDISRELIEGMKAMKGVREGKLRLRRSKVEELGRAGGQLDVLFEAAGTNEEELVQDFKQLRARKRQKSK